tara:strand:- start:1422 stop:1730 length:309 start_codon:yes stop_codon:yes gene_type:complete
MLTRCIALLVSRNSSSGLEKEKEKHPLRCLFLLGQLTQLKLVLDLEVVIAFVILFLLNSYDIATAVLKAAGFGIVLMPIDELWNRFISGHIENLCGTLVIKF